IVKDALDSPLIGVSIVLKGTTQGVISDVDGRFALSAKQGDVLQISYVGYVTQEVKVDGNKLLQITMQEDLLNLEEVVVVGYGTQKKVNLTGSVSSVSSDALESRPITQASQALSGLVSGVTISQSSGSPGGDQATIRIRGLGTFSGAGCDPLVLIDGLSGSINDVDPNNIETITVLKDAASAAIYGTRAANGVILIETKRGKKGKIQVSYNGYVGVQRATELPDLLDSWDYATLKNEADINGGGSATYTDAEIELFRNGTDPDNYPNVNHMKDLVTSGSGFQTGHNVSFSSGTDRLSYMFSMGYLRHEGIVAKNDYTKYNFQLNVDNQILSNLSLKASFSGYTSQTNEPYTGDGDMNRMIGMSVRENAAIPGRKSDGTYGYQDLFCPEGWMDSQSFLQDNYKNLLAGVEVSWEPLKGLVLSGKVGYNYTTYYNKKYISELVFDENYTYSPNSLNVSNGNENLTTLQFLAKYGKTFNKEHRLDVMFGISQESFLG
ncbi:MAG: SusC/RagA family TonB-linked outer membrane protein, partial [Bacteroides sp.]|nr:SusC/RagA family TonB-linked outer membrane protein [Bacteroides sp.]